MPLTKVEVIAIADGTDGQVITWDADGTATTTGPGGAGTARWANARSREPAGNRDARLVAEGRGRQVHREAAAARAHAALVKQVCQ